MTPVPIRVLTWDIGAIRAHSSQIGEAIRTVRPDFACLQGAPTRLRWRSRSAGVARQAEMLTAGGGPSGGGNLVLASFRVNVFGTQQSIAGPDGSDVAVAVGEVSRVRVVVCATRLGTASLERTRRAGDLVERLKAFGGKHQILCAEPTANPAGAIQVSPGVRVLDWWLGEGTEGATSDRERPVVADLLLGD